MNSLPGFKNVAGNVVAIQDVATIEDMLAGMFASLYLLYLST